MGSLWDVSALQSVILVRWLELRFGMEDFGRAVTIFPWEVEDPWDEKWVDLTRLNTTCYNEVQPLPATFGPSIDSISAQPKEAMSVCLEPSADATDGCEMISLQVLCLNGEGCKLTLPPSTLGREVRQMVLEQLPKRGGDLHCSTLLHRLCSAKRCRSRALKVRTWRFPALMFLQICVLHGAMPGAFSEELRKSLHWRVWLRC